MLNSEFINNTATSGAAMTVKDSAYLTIINSLFDYNLC